MGSGSPIDTTGSLSDSFYISSELGALDAGSQQLDNERSLDPDAQSKYQLHR